MKRHIPNIITACNLICGCIATWAAFMGSFTYVDMQKVLYLPGAKFAFLFILLGAVFDFFDGMVARKLGVSGPLGIQLDSLADVITFGLAPGAMIFSLFTRVYYPQFMYEDFWFKIMPFTAFLLPAFAAFRLANFNIDTRQREGFIGLPTPASAIFWAALICGCSGFLTSHRFNAPFLFALLIIFCYLMVSDIPMFKLKFHDMKWQTEGNKPKLVFIAIALLALLAAAIMGYMDGQIVIYLSRAAAAIIAFYIIMSIVLMYRNVYKQDE